MSNASPSLLLRLRRHRGLMVLAIVVLLLKFVAGTACLAYDTDNRVMSATTATTVTMPADIAALTDLDADASDCVLGEVGGCHCSCAHGVPLSVAALMRLPRLNASAVSTLLQPSRKPVISGSVHRPPIA